MVGDNTDQRQKLLNDIGGMRKKMKLDAVAAVTLPEIEGWQK